MIVKKPCALEVQRNQPTKIARQRNRKTPMSVIGLKDGVLHRYVSPLLAFNNKVASDRNNTVNGNGVTALFFPMAERRKGERN